jgi:hypothetical protein
MAKKATKAVREELGDLDASAAETAAAVEMEPVEKDVHANAASVVDETLVEQRLVAERDSLSASDDMSRLFELANEQRTQTFLAQPRTIAEDIAQELFDAGMLTRISDSALPSHVEHLFNTIERALVAVGCPAGEVLSYASTIAHRSLGMAVDALRATAPDGAYLMNALYRKAIKGEIKRRKTVAAPSVGLPDVMSSVGVVDGINRATSGLLDALAMATGSSETAPDRQADLALSGAVQRLTSAIQEAVRVEADGLLGRLSSA